MVHIAIVDDEEIFAKKLRQDILHLFADRQILCQASIYTDPTKFILAHQNKPFDLIYLDIDMSKKSGIETASEIRKNKTDTHLIFVSSYSHFVFDTFQYAPYRFIRKEKLETELFESVKSYCEEVYSKKQFLSFHFENNQVKNEDITKILYFFSLRHDVFICYSKEHQERLANRMYTMEQLENMLKPYGFIRIHKTYLVNCRYIYQIYSNSVSLVLSEGGDDIELPLSGRRLAEVKAQYQLFTRGSDAL